MLSAARLGRSAPAAAVYLTLRVQRDDETQKVGTAILTEVAQLAKFPVGQLETCRLIAEGYNMPRVAFALAMKNSYANYLFWCLIFGKQTAAAIACHLVLSWHR